jgi:cell division initiation protein
MANARPSSEPVTLRTKFGGGYDTAQVDELISKLHGEIGQLTGEVNRLSNELKASREETAKMRAMSERLASQESAIKDALITAQRAAEEVNRYAQDQADAIVEEARHKAEEAAKSYETRINDLRWELERLKIERDRFVREFRAMLENHLRELSNDTQPEHPTVVNSAVIEAPAPAPAPITEPATEPTMVGAEDFISG